MNIGETTIETGSVYFIAEAGINHNGDPELAKELVDVAVSSGADAVKFQTFAAERLVTDDSAAFEEIKQWEFDRETFETLQAYANDQSIDFISTPFDPESAAMLDSMGVPAIKLGSGELNNHPLLAHVAEFGRPMIVSTGMGTMDEVLEARDVIRDASTETDVTFLECTSAYPTPVDQVNLRRIQEMKAQLDHPVGFSDHTMMVEMPALAVVAGAVVVEKHITVDRSLPGPDQDVSLEPDELTCAVSLARDAAGALGTPEKAPTIDGENRTGFRKSVHATEPIPEGSRVTEEDIGILRPGEGIEPKRVADVIGTEATVDIKAGEPITEEKIAFES